MKKSAFTLIELLVTIVLFSLLLATALYSFRFVSINMRNINNTNPQKAINYDLLRGVIGSIYYYVSFDKNEKNINKKFYHYFKGSPKECYFITESPLFTRELSIGHLKYEEGELWYEEGKVFDKSVNYMQLDNIPLTQRLLISNRLKDVSFIYHLYGEKREEIQNKIPLSITIKIEGEFQEKSYIFKIKADNYQHIQMVIREGKSY